ncbi:O-methyltransferase [Bacillus taeanensis]|uniref:tRNA 5-hydroxyuridine methyltransferase n=1 Tax=Bacillus taeanensis TaxID=273032 RepID=A0A366Y232_9BACI|nr:O-methyltransferase [Bacillus taeanensis]RBW70454.1 SAM-dependent methyltransferase [Bacillus taeanensis]
MVSTEIQEYIVQLRKPLPSYVTEMELYAKEHHVPIMDPVSMEAMLNILQLKKPKRILEIGTAIGYSAIRMALSLPECEIITIERDEERFQFAKQNIHKAGLTARIKVIEGDALEAAEEVKYEGPYDALFIDAAKGQYMRFHDTYAEHVQSGGIIISDNVLFRGLVAEEEVVEKRFRSMVKKLKQYNKFLMEHPDYSTTIYPIGDGIAVSIKEK